MIVVAALAALSAATLAAGLTGHTDRASAQAQPGPDVCQTNLDKTAAPSSVPLGQTVTVTLKVDGSCPSRDKKADVVLVIDRSYSMSSNNKLAAAKAAARDFVDGVDPAHVHVGLVALSSTAQRIHGLTSDQVALRDAIDNLPVERGTNLVDAFEMALRELTGAAARPGVAHVIVFMTDGRHSTGPPISDLDPMLAAARSSGIEIFAIALGNDADRTLMQQIASDASHFYDSPTPAELATIYSQIAGRIEATVLLKTALITDEVPANMDYVAGSGMPAEPSVSPDGKTLTWNLTDVKDTGTTFTYQLRPQEVGTWPTNVGAKLDYTDGFDNKGQETFPVPVVTVTSATGAPCVCRVFYLPWRISSGDRDAVVAAAEADPNTFYGWNLLLDEGKPGAPPYPDPAHDEGPNPRRTCLDLRDRNIPYHPTYNQPVWRAGCLVGPGSEAP
jgi:Mg-chelatase subunit ChlD